MDFISLNLSMINAALLMIDEHNIDRLIAGGTSGAISRTISAPLDRIKLMRQTRDDAYGYLKGRGFRSLWNGNSIALLKIVPSTAIKLISFEYYNEEVNIVSGYYRRMAAGALAGLTSSSIIYPLDLIKTRYVTDTFSGSLPDCIRGIVREGGIKGLFRGYSINAAIATSTAGISFLSYGIMRDSFLCDESLKHRLICASSSGAISQAIVFPLDTIKRRMQIGGDVSPKKLMRGSLFECARGTVSTGVAFAVYDTIMYHLSTEV